MSEKNADRSMPAPGKKSRKRRWLRYVLLAGSAALLGVFVALVVFRLSPESGTTENCPVIRLFSDGRLLFFADIETGEKTCSYDPETHEVTEVIDEAVAVCFLGDEDVVYGGEEGLFLLDRESKEKKLLLPYGQEKRERVKELNGEALLDTPVTEGCSGFCEENGLLCFVYRASRQLQTDEHTILGEERWATLYCYDRKNGLLSAVKNDYSKKSGLFYHGLRLIDGKLYYQKGNDVFRLSLDGKEEERIYQADGRWKAVYWNKNFFYSVERAEKDSAKSASEEQETGLFARKISLNGEILSSWKLEDRTAAPFQRSGPYYDAAADLFYAYYGEKLICFSLEDPKAYTVRAEIKNEDEYFREEILAFGDRVYVALFPTNGRVRRAKDYVIVEVNKQNEAVTVIKNGKPVSR